MSRLKLMIIFSMWTTQAVAFDSYQPMFAGKMHRTAGEEKIIISGKSKQIKVSHSVDGLETTKVFDFAPEELGKIRIRFLEQLKRIEKISKTRGSIRNRNRPLTRNLATEKIGEIIDKEIIPTLQLAEALHYMLIKRWKSVEGSIPRNFMPFDEADAYGRHLKWRYGVTKTPDKVKTDPKDLLKADNGRIAPILWAVEDYYNLSGKVRKYGVKGIQFKLDEDTKEILKMDPDWRKLEVSNTSRGRTPAIDVGKRIEVMSKVAEQR